MSFGHSKNSRVLLNEIHVSGDVTNYSVSLTRELSEVTTLLDTGCRYLPGLKSGTVSVQGVLDVAAAGSLYNEAVTTPGVDDGALWTVLPDGLTVGNFAFITVSDPSGFTVDSTVHDAVKLSIEGTADDGVDLGVSLHGLTAETTGTNAASVDNLAATTNGGVGVVHVTAYTGFTNVVPKIQDSADNISFADILTFTTVTGVTSQRSLITGNVRRYIRALWTVSGTGSITFAMAFARR